MDQEQTFYDQPVDHTPYAAFIWVVALALLITTTAGYGVWRLGGWVKGRHVSVDINHTGNADALLNQVQQAGNSALDQAKNAASNAAGDAANSAAKAGTDAVKQEVKTQADQQLQQFINQ